MSDIAVQLVDPEDNSQNQYPRTLAQLVETSGGSDVETELGKKLNPDLQGASASDVSPASGDKLVITDNSDSGKVARSNIEFGSDTTKYLRNDGQWGTPSGGGTSGVSDVKIVWGTGSSQASTVTNNVSSIMVHGTYDPNNLQRVATLKIPSSISGSGYLVEYNTSTKNLDVTSFKTSDLCLGFKKDGVNVWYYPGFGVNSNNNTVGGVILGSGLGLVYDSANHTVTITASGGGSYTAGDGIDITSGSISVTTAYAFTVGSPSIGGLLVTAEANCSAGFCNTDDVVAVPIFHGSVSEMAIQDAEKTYDGNEPLSDYECHYVNVRAILDAIINDNTGLLDILKDALGLKQ